MGRGTTRSSWTSLSVCAQIVLSPLSFGGTSEMPWGRDGLSLLVGTRIVSKILLWTGSIKGTKKFV